MKKKEPIIFIIFMLSCLFSVAQQKAFTFKKQSVINFENIKEDYSPALMVKEMPKPGSQKMVQYNYPNTTSSTITSKKNQTLLSDLSVGYSAFGNPWGSSTPNDNDIAISDSGIIMSVVNTNIYIYNTKTSTASPVKSLAAFTAPVNNKHQESDPKVLYDPKTDRFIFMCFTGFVDTTSTLIFGFSQTNNPAGNWNLYKLPGNPLNNHLWSDYPMLAMTEKELFLSINLLYNDSSWQTGFVETVIWQIKKDSGYAGLPLGAIFHSNIKYGSKSIRNLCPAKGGSKLYKPNMFFVSNRNFASQNDTVFLVEVKDTIGAPTNTVTVKVLKTNQPYYFPPGGRQTIVTQTLATNDARTLGAFYENNKIHYVHNTNNPLNNHVTAYYGVIDNPQSLTPTVSGYIIDNDTVDFGYPNVSYAGLNATDNTAIISFNHSSNKLMPGCSAIKSDGAGNFSKVFRIKNGAKPINLLSANLERWGDYSGSQTRYNHLGEVWISGYYGYQVSFSYPNVHGAWIAQIGKDNSVVAGLNENKENNSATPLLFPNPTSDFFTVDFTLPQIEYVSFELYDATGKLVSVLLRDWVKVTQNSFQFNLSSNASGIYYLKLTGNKGTNITKKIIKN